MTCLYKCTLVVWYIIVMLVVAALTILILVLLTPDRPDTVGYDCQLAEISPDVPLAYKQACRESRRNK
jgi:hypothetical protein